VIATAARTRRVRTARLWLRLWREFSFPERWRLLAALAAMLVASAITALSPLLLGVLIDETVSGNEIDIGGSLGLFGLIAGILLFAQLLQVMRRQLVENVATGFERDSRVRAYERLLRLDLVSLRAERAGSVYGRANRSIEGAVKLVKLGALDLLPAISLAVAALIVAVATEPLVGLVMVGVVPTGFAFVYFQIKSQKGIRVELREHKDAIDGQVMELLPALDTIRAAGAEEHFLCRVAAACGELRGTELRHHRAMSLFDAAKSVNEGFWLIAVLFSALTLASGGAASAGQITAFVLLFSAVLTPLRELHRILDEASEAALQTHDLFDLLDSPLDQSYEPERGPSRPTASAAPALLIRKLIYSHHPDLPPTLDGLDLTVEPGERIGIVGASGCGKSTLLRLITRLHHGYSGHIELAGAELVGLGRNDLAERLGYVSQQPHIFQGSVRDNICLGHAVSDEELVDAARRAHIHETILAMPEGYDAQIAERGDSVSGGQRQRICLARVLLRRPELLLLDEPTSALDPGSERAVQDAIDQLDGISMLIVAHRLSTLRGTDRIAVLDQGGVVEEGAFAELAVAGGHFAEMLAVEHRDAHMEAAQAA